LLGSGTAGRRNETGFAEQSDRPSWRRWGRKGENEEAAQEELTGRWDAWCRWRSRSETGLRMTVARSDTRCAAFPPRAGRYPMPEPLAPRWWDQGFR